MLLYLNILVLLLLQLDVSSPTPLTAPSMESSTCKTNSTQALAFENSNATALSVGELCGVYTLSCAQGLRCSPPQGEPRPLRALLEGRGVCSNASIISPTENIQTAGKCHTYCACRTMWMNEVESLRIVVCILNRNTHYFGIVSRWIHVESVVSRNVSLGL